MATYTVSIRLAQYEYLHSIGAFSYSDEIRPELKSELSKQLGNSEFLEQMNTTFLFISRDEPSFSVSGDHLVIKFTSDDPVAEDFAKLLNTDRDITALVTNCNYTEENRSDYGTMLEDFFELHVTNDISVAIG